MQPYTFCTSRANQPPARPRTTQPSKVWHDNERFLLQPEVYKRHGLQLIRFPPNSGDLNPIETLWAKLRRDLAKQEQDDFARGRVLSLSEFRARVGQLTRAYGMPVAGHTYSYIQKLVRGMLGRLLKCRSKNYGRCGK